MFGIARLTELTIIPRIDTNTMVITNLNFFMQDSMNPYI